MAISQNTPCCSLDPTVPRARSGVRPIVDPLAFAREANAAYLRWRGALVPSSWRRLPSVLGVTFCRDDLLVVGSLEASDETGARSVTVSLSRLTGSAPTEADVRAVMADFLAAGATASLEHRGGIACLYSRVSFERPSGHGALAGLG